MKDNLFFQLGNGIVKDILSSSHELGKRSISDDLSPSEYSNLCLPAVEHQRAKVLYHTRTIIIKLAGSQLNEANSIPFCHY